MAEEHKSPKTRTVGHYPLDVAKQWPGWGNYMMAAAALTEALAASAESKRPIKDLISADLAAKKAVTEDAALDFNIDGDRVRVVELLNKKRDQRRSRSRDLSSLAGPPDESTNPPRAPLRDPPSVSPFPLRKLTEEEMRAIRKNKR